MDKVSINFDMEPVAKGRPRVTRTGHAFTPAKTRKAEEHITKVAREAMSAFGVPPWQGPLKVVIRMWFKRPKSNKSKWHTQRPDADNCAKLVLDGCNGIVWGDDSQIVELTVKKLWHTYGYIEMDVYTVEQGGHHEDGQEARS